MRPLGGEAGFLVSILTGYNLLEGFVCVLPLHLQRSWHHLIQLILKSVQCEIQMGGNKIEGKGIHELKQSLNVLCMQGNLH